MAYGEAGVFMARVGRRWLTPPAVWRTHSEHRTVHLDGAVSNGDGMLCGVAHRVTGCTVTGLRLIGLAIPTFDAFTQGDTIDLITTEPD